MTANASYLADLDAAARAASAAEIDFQKAAADRAAQLREERAFAWRRLNLLRGVAAAVREAEDAGIASAAGRAAMLRAVGWSGDSDSQRAVADRFAPVVLSLWGAGGAEAADPAAALAEFEAWYAADRGVPFLALMEREIVELPLVEV